MTLFTRSVTTAVTLIAAALLALAAAPSASAAGAANGDSAKADSAPSDAAKSAPAAFNNVCRTCHSLKAGDHRIGPSLHKLIGSKSGVRPGYASSSAAMKNAGIVWNEQMLDRFIENPEVVVPNNNLKPYAGLPDKAARESIVAYLKSAARG